MHVQKSNSLPQSIPAQEENPNIALSCKVITLSHYADQLSSFAVEHDY